MENYALVLLFFATLPLCSCSSNIVSAQDEISPPDVFDITLDSFAKVSLVEIFFISWALLVCFRFDIIKGKKTKADVPDEQGRDDTDREHRPSRMTVTRRTVADPEHGTAVRRFTPTTNNLVSTVRTGRSAELPKLLRNACVKAAAGNDEILTVEEHCCELIHASMLSCVTHRCFDDAIRAYEAVQDFVKVGNPSLWSILLFVAAEAKRAELGIVFFNRLQKLENLSGNDYANTVRCLIEGCDIASFKQMLCDLEVCGIRWDSETLDKVFNVCTFGNRFDFADVLLSSGLCNKMVHVSVFIPQMKSCLARGSPEKCFNLRDLMKAYGVPLNALTHGMLLEAAARCKDIRAAREALEAMNVPDRSFRAINCKNVISSLVDAGMLREAEDALQILQLRGAAPFVLCYELVAGAYRDAGLVRESLELLMDARKQGAR